MTRVSRRSKLIFRMLYPVAADKYITEERNVCTSDSVYGVHRDLGYRSESIIPVKWGGRLRQYPMGKK